MDFDRRGNTQGKKEQSMTIKEKIRAAILEAIRSEPGIALGDLLLSFEVDIGNITIAEIVGATGNGISAKSMTDEVSTRLKSERVEFDANVRRILAGSEISLCAEVISCAYKDTHGQTPSPEQLRKSLMRSVSSGLVKRKGKARGTSYELTAKGRKA